MTFAPPDTLRDRVILKAMHGILAHHYGLFPESWTTSGPASLEGGETALARCLENARPKRRQPSAYAHAAAYVMALVRERPFPQGNEALALMTAYVFLRLHGRELTAPQTEAVATIRLAAAGKLGAAGLADWLRENTRPAPVPPAGRP